MLDNSCTQWLFHYSVRLECPTEPRISRTRKRKTPEPCIIGAVSSLTKLPTCPLMDLIADTVITTAASRHRASQGCALRMSNHRSAETRAPKPSVRGCDSGLLADRSASACSFALAALVVWFEIGVWRTLGGPTPADDVDLTLMIREGQTGQVKRPPHRPRPGMSRGPRRQRPRTPHEIGGVGGGLYHTLGALARRTAPRLEAAAE